MTGGIIPEVVGIWIGLLVLTRWPLRTFAAAVSLLAWAVIFPNGIP